MTADRDDIEGEQASTYSYTIYDADPAVSSGGAWPSHEDVEIEAEEAAEAIAEVRDVMSVEASPSDYDVGDRLWAYVWDVDGVIVGTLTYELTADDLGIKVRS